MDGKIPVKFSMVNFQFLKWITFLLFLFLLFPTKVFAQGAPSVKIRYEAEYLLGRQGDAKVKFNIKIKNLRSDVYVKRFKISFPGNFQIYNLKGYGNIGEINPKVDQTKNRILVQVELENPAIGKGTENNIKLEFLQKNLVRIEGNIWEIILPTVERKGQEVESYSIKVTLPQRFNKKLSLSKPKPTYINKRTIYWEDVKSKVVYAVLGSPQYYKVNLKYAVKNDHLTPVFVYIAFPPETLYQKVLVEEIIPNPAEVKIDEDGNYLGKYFLKPKERLEVMFKGYISTFSQPREDYMKVISEEFKSQKFYLLRERRYWKLEKNVLPISEKNFTTREKAKIIFNYIVEKLSYNFKKVNQRKIQRLGASEALKQLNNAVCTEFTDLFIALARENGIYAREIEGYGYSQDRSFRPLSLITDVLHAWPEYWDNEFKIWVPIDPTWQDTSGIDYFSSLDFNHIAFVIHGKDDTYPLPAGAYKVEDRKDVLIEPVIKIPIEKQNLKVKIKQSKIFKERYLFKGKDEEVVIKIKNLGNSFILGKTLKLDGTDIRFSKDKFPIFKLAPYQEKEFRVKIFAVKEGKAKMVLRIENNKLMNVIFDVKPLWYIYFSFFFQNYLYFIIIFIIIFLPFLLLFIHKS